MRFDVITIFPEMFESPLKQGVVGQAVQRGDIQVSYVNPRQFTQDFHKTVDDRPYGGGDGMVMLAQPLKEAIDHCKSTSKSTSKALAKNFSSKVIYLSPQGKPLTHEKVLELSKVEHLILLCGRYGGVDQRLLKDHVDEEISIGDYVLSGGEIAALVLIDSISRQLPGVLGNAESKDVESFSDHLLEAPLFTRPAQLEGVEVPSVLMSGHHENIKKVRRFISILRTEQMRPDLLKYAKVSEKELYLAHEYYDSLSEIEKSTWGLT